MMKRRDFLRFLGLMPTAVLIPKPDSIGELEVWTPISEAVSWEIAA